MTKESFVSFLSGAFVFITILVSIPFTSQAYFSSSEISTGGYNAFACPAIYEPVCAKKHKTLKTYGNYCEMRMDRAIFITNGSCPSNPICNTSSGEVCPTPFPTFTWYPTPTPPTPTATTCPIPDLANPPAGCYWSIIGNDTTSFPGCSIPQYKMFCNPSATPITPPNACKTWYDGCNTCTRSSVGSPLACTMMYCSQPTNAFCKEYFFTTPTGTPTPTPSATPTSSPISTPSPTSTIPPFVCPADAKLCPDGKTWVSRNPNLGCNFNTCPAPTVSPTATPFSPTPTVCPMVSMPYPPTGCVYVIDGIDSSIPGCTLPKWKLICSLPTPTPTPTPSPVIIPPTCQIWYDGCNTCMRSTIGGSPMCTKMACFQNSGAYCIQSFSHYSPSPTAIPTNTPIITPTPTPTPTTTAIPTPTPMMCPMDAKLCPDGKTWVGRSAALNCAFITCPTTPSPSPSPSICPYTPTPTITPTPTVTPAICPYISPSPTPGATNIMCPAITPEPNCVFTQFERDTNGCLKVTEKYCFK